MLPLSPATRARRRVRDRAGRRSSSPAAACRSSAWTATPRCSRRPVELGPAVTLDRARTSRRSTSVQVFDVVVMAGNVPLFTPTGDAGRARRGRGAPRRAGRRARRRLPARARVRAGRVRRALWPTRGSRWTARWATWDRDPFPGDGSYAVSLLRRAGRVGRQLVDPQAVRRGPGRVGGGELRVAAAAWRACGIRHGFVRRNFATAGPFGGAVGLGQAEHGVVGVVGGHVADRPDDRPVAAARLADLGDRRRLHVERDHAVGGQLARPARARRGSRPT